jgi:hypothetical protein
VFVKGIRRSIGVVLVGIAIFVGFSGTAFWSGTAHAAAQSTGEAENTLTADINQERTSRGLGALTVASDLVAYARQHSAEMAAAGRPYHDPNIQSNVQNWQELGDNVGSGPDADHLHQGFMNSQIHRDEILMPSYTEVGVGCYWAGNVLYVTEVFRLPEQARPAVAQATAPAPRPVSAPRVVVRTAAVPAPAPAAPAAPPTTAAAPPTTASSTSTSTSLVAAATPEWPPASLKTQRTASHGASDTALPAVALVAAVLLMLVAGIEVHSLRRRAERS